MFHLDDWPPAVVYTPASGAHLTFGGQMSYSNQTMQGNSIEDRGKRQLAQNYLNCLKRTESLFLRRDLLKIKSTKFPIVTKQIACSNV